MYSQLKPEISKFKTDITNTQRLTPREYTAVFYVYCLFQRIDLATKGWVRTGCRSFTPAWGRSPHPPFVLTNSSTAILRTVDALTIHYELVA